MEKLKMDLQRFSSTNKTTYYDLSQYTGSDKPTYLGDYNSDMQKIDAGIRAAQVNASANEDNIGTLNDLTTTAKTNLVVAINEIDSHADTNAGDISTLGVSVAGNTTHIGDMLDLETTDKSSLVNAINELKAIINNFNLTSYTTINQNDIVSNGGTLGDRTIKVAKNSDGSLAKIYGVISLTAISGSNTITIHNSGLNPANDIVINNAGILRIGSSPYSPSAVDITIKTNGDIEINPKNLEAGSTCLYMLFPCLYFVKDFGDVPINQ